MMDFEEMLARMAILRIVAAPDVSASPAQAQMHPRVAHGEAFLTTIAAWDHFPYHIEVGALLPSFSQGSSVEIRIDAGTSRTSRANRVLSPVNRSRESAIHAFAKPPAYFSNIFGRNGARRPRAV
jgi:hypothetical protein